MRALMRSLAPDCFDDVAALVALYRPGPMAANMHNDYADRKNGRKPVEYLHADAEESLGDTYGLMIYQESLMRVAQKFAGYSLAEADNLRRACGKKIREKMREERVRFVDACEKTGYGKDLGGKWFDIIEPFADYAFAKAHAYGYGLIAYQTAYLKANYAPEYLSCLLTSVKASLEKAAVYLADCRASSIDVKVPDVNLSVADFAPVLGEDGERDQIVFGMSAIRNVGEGLVRLVVQEREANGPFADFYDFCERVDLMVLNKRAIEALIKAGAFDSVGHTRKGLLLAFETIIDQTTARRRERDMGVMSLFGTVDLGDEPAFDERPRISDVEFDKRDRLAFEKEMLGLYVSDHPLLGAEAVMRRRSDCTITDLADVEEGHMKVLGGVVTGLQRKWTKRGDLMAVFQLEDLQTSCEVMVFPKTMTEHGHKLADDVVVFVKGRVDKREEQPKLMALEIDVFEGITDGAPPLRIRMSPQRIDEGMIERLKGLLREHPGEAQVFLHLGERQVLRLPDQFCVDTSHGLVGELRVLLGADSLVL
jgi:DNA polymerase-3 subunit alpha